MNTKKKMNAGEFIRRGSVPMMFILICALCIPIAGLSPTYLANEIVTRMGRNAFLILSLLIPIMAGMGLNFGMTLGAMAGEIGLILASDWQIVGIPGMVLAMIISVPISVLLGLFCGRHSTVDSYLVVMLEVICGVALVSLNGVVNFQMRPIGDLMALGAMASWGLYSVLVDKANARGVPPLTAIRKAFFWALVMMAPLAVWGATEQGYYALDGSFSVTLDADINIERFSRLVNWVNIAFLGGVASAACFVLWNGACKALGVVRTTVGLYLTPIVGVVFAWLFLGERLTAMSAAGGVVIVAGVVVANYGFWRDGK